MEAETSFVRRGRGRCVVQRVRCGANLCSARQRKRRCLRKRPFFREFYSLAGGCTLDVGRPVANERESTSHPSVARFSYWNLGRLLRNPPPNPRYPTATNRSKPEAPATVGIMLAGPAIHTVAIASADASQSWP